MASVNKVIIVGNLGRDPETRYMPDGDAITNISVATTDKWKDKSGEMQEKTEWHRVAFFGKLAEIAGEYLKKGSQVYVEGRLQTRKWQDKDGVTALHHRDRRQPDADAGLAPGHGRRRPRGLGEGGGASSGGGAPGASKPAAAKAGGRQVRRHGRRHPVLAGALNFHGPPAFPGCKNCRRVLRHEAHRPVPRHQPRRDAGAFRRALAAGRGPLPHAERAERRDAARLLAHRGLHGLDLLAAHLQADGQVEHGRARDRDAADAPTSTGS